MRTMLKLLIPALLIISIFANLFMFTKYRNRRAYLKVNNQTITLQDLYDYLQQDKGPVVKLILTQRAMLDQEANKKHLAPTEAEIAEEFNQQREMNWQFAQRLSQNPWVEGEAKNQIRQGIEQNRLRALDVPVTDDQIKEEYAAHPQDFDTPNKAHCQLALLRSLKNVDQIKELLEKNVSPMDIMLNFAGDVIFLGDHNKFTFAQHYGMQENQVIFNMKPDQVAILPPGEFANQGIQKLVVKMLDIVPGKKADLNDPKTREKVRLLVALKRAKPVQEYMMALWAATDFHSEDPNDKRYIESMMAPDHHASTQ